MDLMKNGLMKNGASVFGHRPKGYGIEVINFDNVVGNTQSFDISELQSGVYFVTIQTIESGTIVKKVIKIQ